MLPTGTVLGDFTGKNKTKQKQKKLAKLGRPRRKERTLNANWRKAGGTVGLFSALLLSPTAHGV